MKPSAAIPMGFLALALCMSAQAQVAAKKRAPATRVVQNCVGSDKVSFRTGRDGVMLGLEDRVAVAAAIVARYPMIERDGLYPSSIALWRRPDGAWVYATMVSRLDVPHTDCYTANVTAAEMPMTPTLLKKYFGLQSATPL